MRRGKLIPVAALGMLFLSAAPGRSAASRFDLAGSRGLEGFVETSKPIREGTNELPRTLVFAYNMASSVVQRVETDAAGRFFFRDLVPGVYKLVAYRPGFLPAVSLLFYSSGMATFAPVTLRLENAGKKAGALLAAAEGKGPAGPSVDPWEVRAAVPTDILREIALAGGAATEPGEAPADMAVSSGEVGPRKPGLLDDRLSGRFSGEMSALAGYGSAHDGSSWTETSVGVEGDLGKGWKMGVTGEYAALSGRRAGLDHDSSLGQTTSLAIDLEPGERQSYRILTTSNQWEYANDRSKAGASVPVDYAMHSVSWKRAIGERGISNVKAQYVEENNFFRAQMPRLDVFPESSRSIEVAGSYYQPFEDDQFLQVGLLFRRGDGDLNAVSNSSPAEQTELYEEIGLYANAGWSPWQPLLIEYGFYTQVDGGGLALAPRGGLAYRLGKHVQLTASAEARVQDEAGAALLLSPVVYGNETLPARSSRYHYETGVAVTGDNADRVSFAASRKAAEGVVRLVFDDNFFNSADSVYLFAGDVLDELRLEIVKDWSRRVSGSLTSSYGQVSGDDQAALSGRFHGPATVANDARFATAKLATYVKPTHTGVYLIVHSATQHLSYYPRGAPQHYSLAKASLRVAQDLGFLADLTADWKLLVSVEVAERVRDSRAGSRSALSGIETERRLMGGVSVRF